MILYHGSKQIVEYVGNEVVYGNKNNNALFYTCSLIEYIGRVKKDPDRM